MAKANWANQSIGRLIISVITATAKHLALGSELKMYF